MLTEYKDICVICGRPKEHTHHLIFGWGMRKLCDDDKITCPLCEKCHEEIHNSGVAGGLSKIVGQLLFEMDLVKKVFRKIWHENSLGNAMEGVICESKMYYLRSGIRKNYTFLVLLKTM